MYFSDSVEKALQLSRDVTASPRTLRVKWLTRNRVAVQPQDSLTVVENVISALGRKTGGQDVRVRGGHLCP